MIGQKFSRLVMFLLFLILHPVNSSSNDNDNSDEELECSLGPGRLAGCLCHVSSKDTLRRVSCENQKLQSIPTNIPNLLDLKISDDNMPTLTKSIPYPDLEALHLERNEIQYIGDAIFQPLKSLKTLSLAYNKITNLRQEIFDGLVSLELLVLTGNSIFQVRANVFNGSVLPALLILKLDRCSLFSIEPNSFSGLSQLTSLNLAVNNIQILPVFGDKNALYNLTHINASDNHLKQVSRSSFVNLPSLSYLYLDKNSLTELSSDTFPYSLTFLSLRANRISSIGVDSLYPLRKLNALDLSYNLLPRLNSSEPPWDVLEKILAHDNPWDCSDCANSWLVDESAARSWNSDSNVTCATPSALSGRSVYRNGSTESVFAKCVAIVPNVSFVSGNSIAIAVVIGIAASVVVLSTLAALLMKNRSRKFKGKANGEKTSLAYSKMSSPFAIADEDDELEPL